MSLLVPFPPTKIISIPIPETVKLSWFDYITFKLHFPFVDATKLVKVCCIKMPTHLQLTHINNYEHFYNKRYKKIHNKKFPAYYCGKNDGFWDVIDF